MNNSHGRYVLATELVSPMGMNLELSLAIAKADLARFEQKPADNGIDKYNFAKIDFISGESLFSRVTNTLSILLDSLLDKIPTSLKPVPLMISIPSPIFSEELQCWFDEKDYSRAISNIDIQHSSGPQYIEKTINKLDSHDALISISIDSLVERIEDLIASNQVLGSNNPWGIIPSEGGAGMVLARKNIIDTLKLQPVARFGHFDAEYGVSDRRAMMRIVQRLSKKIQSFGWVFSDMTNTRNDTEDYGFALGARAEYFLNPQQPFLINELWGTLGNCSPMALIATAIQENRSSEPSSLLMFSITGDRAILQLDNQF